MEQALQQFRDAVTAAANAGKALRIRGGGSKDWYGQRFDGEILDTRAYSGIVDYEPTELVITARCGTPLAEIEAALAERRQMLAFEPPRFGAGSTIGGVVAAGLSGPRRQAAGAVRDFVLGAALMDGKGEVLRFGGQVMKNVAGYDVSRLLAGSLGTLGLILDVSLKVLPVPYCETTLRLEMDEAKALDQLNLWGGQPLPITASAWHGGVLIVRLSGAEAAVAAAKQKMGGEEDRDAAPFWQGLRDHENAFFSASGNAAPLWRLSLPTVAKPLALEGEQLIEWGGAQRWLRGDADARTVRAAAAGAGGHATLFRGGDKAAGVFHPLAPAIATIHRNLKAAFDPAGIFNPGRMYPEF
ncbi:glycolate oxidase subunit GlcE [Noviherbaspirillum aridicola]|uniref:Glycolate oxidase subunit GlcE n=1 Tax=Noviherbaspirillum aridicola TaxID=2849687 RepID=A0ABQ4Q6Z6_9BURK|nr:glycolate oxidase subunit GlcE [Noviherbaspirillum aridicola]GIZ52938.1 glycolate oxidase subunit GlcE [Noviherbaspirillum aridicola]